ncbi:aldo/keto reductase [Flavobacteriaceae bacterium]|nr:aldo/keto reductase [Flavobacteriaceae bacterium]
MKIALGTVQWGLDYGIANTNGIPNDKALTNILSLALDNNINLLDTAVQYGNAERRLGQLATAENKIITKIGSFSDSNSLENQLENSFKNLKRLDIYGCLFHNSNELLENKQHWIELLNYKKTGKIKKVGYSLYDPEVLVALLEGGFLPDIVQIPYNILDRKFEPYFDLLKSKEVEIHVRSVFLQGLFFKKSNDLPSKIQQLKPVIDLIHSLSIDYNISVLQICLGYVLQKQKIDHIVVGIDHIDQLKEIIHVNQALPSDLIHQIEKIQLEDKALLNPSTW